MGDTSGGTLLAAEIGTGTGGALVVLALILASVALFTFLSGSLRRMRANVASGEFGSQPREKARAAAANSTPPPEPATGGAPAASGTTPGAAKDPDQA